MSEYLIQDSTLTDIADAIRAKTGGTSTMTPAEMVTEIESIETGGGEDKYFEFIERKTYVHAESWENNTLGKGSSYLSTYMPKPESGNVIYFIRAINNTANNYRFTGGWCARTAAVNNADAIGVSIRDGNNYSISWVSNSRSLWCSAGATIIVDKYEMKSLLAFE